MTKSEQSPAPQPAPADKVREFWLTWFPPYCEANPEFWKDWKKVAWDFAETRALASRNQTIKRVRDRAADRRMRLMARSDAISGYRIQELDDLLAELDRELGAGEGRDYE